MRSLHDLAVVGQNFSLTCGAYQHRQAENEDPAALGLEATTDVPSGQYSPNASPTTGATAYSPAWSIRDWSHCRIAGAKQKRDNRPQKLPSALSAARATAMSDRSSKGPTTEQESYILPQLRVILRNLRGTGTHNHRHGEEKPRT